ncbi:MULTISPECIES: hypothetical protein [unclassified Pseudomonas]|uniref:hypothetical protein n=1 Tax=unclassified Pseudomonas TaxID=196821 RepID=UPI000F95B22F|nr:MULTISPECIES: hypothetical protein [unclassified Pseudomonas]
MKKSENKKRSRLLLGVVGLIIFCTALGLALGLLSYSKLSGAEFVTFVIAFALIGAVVAFGPEVQEFSIAGSVVKLKDIKQDALDAIKSLEQARLEFIRSNLRSLVLFRTYEDQKGPRNVDFWAMVKLIDESDSYADLKEELSFLIFHLHVCEKGRMLWSDPDFDSEEEQFNNKTIAEFLMLMNRPVIRQSLVRNHGDKLDGDLQGVIDELLKLESLKKTLESKVS